MTKRPGVLLWLRLFGSDYGGSKELRDGAVRDLRRFRYLLVPRSGMEKDMNFMWYALSKTIGKTVSRVDLKISSSSTHGTCRRRGLFWPQS